MIKMEDKLHMLEKESRSTKPAWFLIATSTNTDVRWMLDGGFDWIKAATYVWAWW